MTLHLSKIITRRKILVISLRILIHQENKQRMNNNKMFKVMINNNNNKPILRLMTLKVFSLMETFKMNLTTYRKI